MKSIAVSLLLFTFGILEAKPEMKASPPAKKRISCTVVEDKENEKVTTLLTNTENLSVFSKMGNLDFYPDRYALNLVKLKTEPNEKLRYSCKQGKNSIKLWENYVRINNRYYELFTKVYGCSGDRKVGKGGGMTHRLDVYKLTRSFDTEGPVPAIVHFGTQGPYANLGAVLGSIFYPKKKQGVFPLGVIGEEEVVISEDPIYFREVGKITDGKERFTATSPSGKIETSQTEDTELYLGTMTLIKLKKYNRVELRCEST